MKSALTLHEKINARSQFSRHSKRRAKIPYDNRLRYLKVNDPEQPYFPQDEANKGYKKTKEQIFNGKR